MGRWAVVWALGVGAVGCRTVPQWPSTTLEPAAGGSTGSIGYAYRAGLASQSFAKPEPDVAEAARAAFEDLAVGQVKATARGGRGTMLDGRAADGRRVRLMLVPRDGQTTASVQVGLFGDEPLSRALLDRIGIRLGTLPPEAIPSEVPSDPGANPFVDREAVSDSVMFRGMTDGGYRDGPVP